MKKKLLFTLLSVFAFFAQAQTNTNLGASAGNAGTSNTNIGYYAGDKVTGSYNLMLGSTAGTNLTEREFNLLIGYRSGYYSNSASSNVYVGSRSGELNQTGNYNVFIGRYAGRSSIGSQNVFVGYRAGYNEPGSNKLYIENSDSNTPLIYGDFSNNIVTINGRLGIGTISPQSLLHLDAKNTRGICSLYSGSNGSVFSDIEFRSKDGDGFTTGLAEDWIISHGKDGFFSGSASTGTTLEFYAPCKGNGYFAPFVFKSDGDVLLASPKNAESGKVGIGVLNPEARLEIYRTGTIGDIWDPRKAFLKLSDGPTSLIFDSNEIYSNSSLAFRSSPGEDIIFRTVSTTGSEDLMVLKANGNLGIGIPNPGSRLAVNGVINSKEVNVTVAGWPDFVFGEAYKLPALSRVEKHINENGDLPGIPSAKAVKRMG